MPEQEFNNAMEKLQEDLKDCNITNDMNEKHKPRYVGRCVIELGDVSRHNVMVSFFID